MKRVILSFNVFFLIIIVETLHVEVKLKVMQCDAFAIVMPVENTRQLQV